MQRCVSKINVIIVSSHCPFEGFTLQQEITGTLEVQTQCTESFLPLAGLILFSFISIISHFVGLLSWFYHVFKCTEKKVFFFLNLGQNSQNIKLII